MDAGTAGMGGSLALRPQLLVAGRGAHDGGAGFHVHAIAAGVVGMPVRVEEEADRFIGGLVNEPDDFPRRAGKVGVDYQHVVFEDDPGAIGRLLEDVVALPEEDARREFAHGGFLAARGHEYRAVKMATNARRLRAGQSGLRHGSEGEPDRQINAAIIRLGVEAAARSTTE